MRYFIVEYEFDPPVSDEIMAAAFDALKPCLEVRGVRRLRSWLAEDKTRGFCEFEAADTQSLRDAYRHANVGFKRVWTGQLFEFGPPSLGA
jgi:hypothetical protein